MTPQERRLRLDNMSAMEDGGPWAVMRREWQRDIEDVSNGFDTRVYPQGWALGTKLVDVREYGNDSRAKTLDEVLRVVCSATGISAEEFRGRRKARRLAWRRAMIAKIAKEVCPQCSLPIIGRFLGLHHTTIMHGISNLPSYLERDPELANEYVACCRHFGIKP